MPLNHPAPPAADSPFEPDLAVLPQAGPHPLHGTVAQAGDGAALRRDLSVLAWLAPSLRAALDDAAGELRHFIEEVRQAPEALGARDTTSLRLAGQHLHQAAGAVHIVGLRGLDPYCQALRRLLEALDGGAVPADEATFAVFQRGVLALAEYVDDLMAGDAEEPLRLFQSYADVLGRLGEDRVHPADLWVDELRMLPGVLVGTRMQGSVTRARQRFEAALLQALRLPSPCDDAALLREAFLPLESALEDVRASEQDKRGEEGQGERDLWHVMALAFAALGHGLLPADLLAKRFAARAHLQLRHYLQGQMRVPQALLNDAVFLLVRTGLARPAALPETDAVLALRSDIRQCLQAFRIDADHAVVRADPARRYHGWLDPIDTRNLQQAAAALDKAANARSGDEHGWQTALAALAEAAQPLAQPDLLECLYAVAALPAGAGEARRNGGGDHAAVPAGVTASGVALFLSRALALPWRVHGHTAHPAARQFAARCRELSQCLAGGAHGRAPAWLAQLVEQAQVHALRASAVAQLRGLLDGGESWLDAYDREAPRAEAADHLRDACQAFASLHDTLRTLREQRALPAALHAEAAAVAAAVQGVTARLATLRESAVERGPQLAAIAGELGAVHAFVDALEFGANETAPERGRIVAVEGEAAAEPLLSPVAAAAAPADGDSLLSRAREAARVALEQSPAADAAGVAALRAALRALAEQASIDDDIALRRQADEAVTQLNAWLAGSSGAAARLTAALAPSGPLPAEATIAPAMTAAMPPDGDAVDAELLEIFLGEAGTMLAGVGAILAAGPARLREEEAVYTLRRAFHTLKGSSRMVGLQRYGEAAWAVEQVLNLWIAEARGPATALQALLERAHRELSAWAVALRGDPGSVRDIGGLLAEAQAVRAGEAPVADNAVGVGADAQRGRNEAEADVPADEKADAQPEANDGAQEGAEDDAEDATVLPFRLAAAPGTEDEDVKRIGHLRIGLPLYNVYLQEADTLVRQFATDLSEWRHEGRPCPSELALRVIHTLQGSSATVELEPVRELAEALERLLVQLSTHPVALHPADFRLLEQALERMRGMLHRFAAGIWPEADAVMCRELAGFGERALVRPRIAMPAAPAATPAEAGAPVAMLFGPVGPAARSADVIALKPSAAQDGPAAPDVPDAASSSAAAAPLDQALVDIFLEEAHGSLPELGKLLRAWEADPAQAGHAGPMLRALHTLKGGARMAGAMALGQAAHEMESLLESSVRGQRMGQPVFARLYAWYDRLLAHAEALQAGRLLPVDDADAVNGLRQPQGDEMSGGDVDAAEPAESAASVETGPASATRLPATVPAQAAAVTAIAPEPAERQRALVRVQARTLDTLITDAGEVGASRARVESELEALRSYLGELNANVARLRGQLREIEIQAETQMASRIADVEHRRDFDPLEFDRFTRFQELTRLMAESVGDVATVEQNLQRGFDRAAGDLEAQARLTRGLQRSLMQARMVQFDALAERLYRVARQAANETGKEVRLLIRGGTVEIDRSVLDRMAGPIEHLIRNAVVHGIEPAEVRRHAGKPATGALTLEVQQEGNEVVLHFVDDGGGLDLARIRERAVQRRLLAAGEDASDARLTELIFSPGFSTAEQVSELAGRGVGMDVVRAETVALGGRIALASEPGRGTRFTMHLPLTTAITQVLLVAQGGRLFAVPSGMIEQVQQLRSPALLDAYNSGRFPTAAGDVPFHYFGTLIEEASAIAAGRKYSPIVIVRSGADRVAVHVDEIVGNREVVVKHIGPHLARLEGIAGATTLGDGEIVLIYNPVVLAQRHVRERGEAAPLALPFALQGNGAVAEFGGATGGGAATPVDGLQTQPTVMVVDDSLTVRKAAHRLLTRAGYQVVLARDGVDALRQLQETMPDIMLVDIEMPHMDGFDLTRNVRADARTAHMPLVMITSRTADKHRRYASEIGVNVFLGKPYNEDELLMTLHQLIGERAAGTAGSVAQMLEGSRE
ncbi:Hpt domain-containing protein [Cupriavidus respiraculi]|uniref:histidine kinase n=1 Tax=Cupriavidus respiraculi TaxID=195930 RepID=A0ABM8X2Z1_9BURK|nr:Hpt domain-containing protein [Cupriavidus respiraculi]CAG9174260.1 Sensor histidine kinase RcsC [Cupriavidus respiraculi]